MQRPAQPPDQRPDLGVDPDRVDPEGGARTDTPVVRPAPILTEDNRFFWEAAAEGHLVAQRCRGCARVQHPPRPACPACHCLEQDVIELSGRGVVYSYAVLHHPQSPKFNYPLVAALVDLDEGIRMVTNLVGVEPVDVRIGMPVRVSFEPTADGMSVPVFGTCEPR